MWVGATLAEYSGIRSSVFCVMYFYFLLDVIIKRGSSVKCKQASMSSQTPQTYFEISSHSYKYVRETTFSSKIMLEIPFPDCFIH